MRLADYQSRIETHVRRGRSFADIEELIGAAPVTCEQKAALWLWAWTFVEVAKQRQVARNALSGVSGKRNAGHTAARRRARRRLRASKWPPLLAVVLLMVVGTVAVVGVGVASAATRSGRPGPQTLRGTARADSLFGLGGADALYGLGGPDRLMGGTGNDLLEGGSGADRLSGGAGADELYGAAGADVLYGGPGDDILSAGPGRGWLYGGAGDDVIQASDQGGDRIDCGAGDDEVFMPVAIVTRHCERVWVAGAASRSTAVGDARVLCDDDDPTTTDYEDPETGYCLQWKYP
jgi:hypothetical protein